MSAQLIGLTGLAGSGKDTAAFALVRDAQFVARSLAEPLKAFCADVFGWDHRRLHGPSAERNAPDPDWNGLTARRALQTLGTEWGRAMHPDVWVRYALRSLPAGRACVITDVRFQNEVDAIVRAGGHVVRIHRPAVTLESTHTSEAGQLELTGIAKTIVNDGTIAELQDRVLAAVAALGGGK